jgi:undecaprenyl-diphosphatase
VIEQLRHIDHVLFTFVNLTLANDVFDIICPILREKLVWIPLYILMGYYSFRLYGRQVWILLLFAAATIIISDQVSSSVIKPLVHRLRPCNNHNMVPAARLIIDSCGAGFSFLSSHAANHFAIATFFVFVTPLKRYIALLLYVWASLVAFSQVYVGVHFPADVIAGAMLGIITGCTTGFGARQAVSRYLQLPY